MDYIRSPICKKLNYVHVGDRPQGRIVPLTSSGLDPRYTFRSGRKLILKTEVTVPKSKLKYKCLILNYS